MEELVKNKTVEQEAKYKSGGLMLLLNFLGYAATIALIIIGAMIRRCVRMILFKRSSRSRGSI